MDAEERITSNKPKIVAQEAVVSDVSSRLIIYRSIHDATSGILHKKFDSFSLLRWQSKYIKVRIRYKCPHKGVKRLEIHRGSWIECKCERCESVGELFVIYPMEGRLMNGRDRDRSLASAGTKRE